MVVRPSECWIAVNAGPVGVVRKTRFLFGDCLARQSLTWVVERAFWATVSRMSSLTVAWRGKPLGQSIVVRPSRELERGGWKAWSSLAVVS